MLFVVSLRPVVQLEDSFFFAKASRMNASSAGGVGEFERGSSLSPICRVYPPPRTVSVGKYEEVNSKCRRILPSLVVAGRVRAAGTKMGFFLSLAICCCSVVARSCYYRAPKLHHEQPSRGATYRLLSLKVFWNATNENPALGCRHCYKRKNKN